MAAQLKRKSIVYAVGVLIYITGILIIDRFVVSDWIKFFVFLTAYIVIGFDTLKTLSEQLIQKIFLSEYTLIVLATVGAFGIGRYIEGVFVILLFELGEIFKILSTDNARCSIAGMMDICPKTATRKIRGKETKVDPSELKLRHIIVIKPGERIPVDAVITEGAATIDTGTLTGETIPQAVGPGDRIYSGCLNLNGVVEARVTKVYRESTASRIMETLDKAQASETVSESFVTGFSKQYTLIMLILAILIMVYPPMSFSYGNWSRWIYRGLVFLVAACPSGLVASVPIAFSGGIFSAAKRGIIVKKGNCLKILSKAGTFVLGKTGILTYGIFSVKQIKGVSMSDEELLTIAAHVESHSNHPIAYALMEAYEGDIDKKKVYRVKETAGFGVSATYEGQRVHVGNLRLMEKQKIKTEKVLIPGNIVYVAVGRVYAGYIVISDEMKEEAPGVMGYLKEKCNATLVMLTGDSGNPGEEMAAALKMDYSYTNLMLEDKIGQIEEFIHMQDNSEKLVFVGDGISDTAALKRADIGIAVRNLGLLAVGEADIVLMDDELSKITDVIKIAKATLRTVSQNIIFAMVVKVLVLLLSAIGYFGMWEVILAEAGVMLVAILNAMGVVRYVT